MLIITVAVTMAAGNVAFFALAIVAVAIGTLDNIVIFVMSNKE